MSTPADPRTVASTGAAPARTAPLAAAFRAPWLGAPAFLTGLLWKPVAHTLAVLLRRRLTT